ncbi:MAG: hypothetical protein H6717_14645 [Polyangiaceae bacterium]|nr:hypothetical protein [Polyangiaceae bacterium]
MPLIKVHSSAEPPPKERVAQVLEALSARLAGHLSKPERYVMTCWMPRAEMTFGGSHDPALYVEVKSIGSMTSEQTRAMSADFCALLTEATGVPSSRTYIEFADAKPHLWGFDGDTFA